MLGLVPWVGSSAQEGESGKADGELKHGRWDGMGAEQRPQVRLCEAVYGMGIGRHAWLRAKVQSGSVSWLGTSVVPLLFQWPDGRKPGL